MPRPVTALAALFLTLVTAVGAAAQVSMIQPGQSVRGELGPGDEVRSDDSYQDVYILQGRAGDRIQIDMESSAFDTFLLFGQTVGGSFSAITTDDDGGSGTDSRIVITLEADGLYQILANSLGGGATGAYTLSVRPAAAAAEPEMRNITAGETLQGRLSSTDAVMGDGSYYDFYRYQGQAGETIQIDMESDAFDTYMAFGSGSSASAFSLIESDDDGGSGTDSRITATLSSSGTYLIRANSLSADRTGAYTIRVTRVSGGSVGGSGFSEIFTGETRVGSLSGGDSRLADGSYYDGYLFSGSRGQTITVTMRSDDFDAYLSIGRWQGGSFDGLESDDDGADGTNSRIRITLPATGTYMIRANSLFDGATGRYTLEVQD